MNYIEVTCYTCDPPSVCKVPEDWEIPDEYVCTVCQKRALRRIENATNPHVGRVKHGEVLKSDLVKP